ncbi:MAG: 1-deoxy-D-xylulose-5-phosphate reductoisomerase [Parachlamydiales bacterium]|jgi:1-deoxy-D-xylulose-5-phosphate reductoisomerase
MKKIILLGSSGSVGQNTLQVVRNFPEELEIFALAAKSNGALLEQQILEFKPKMALLFEEAAARNLRSKVKIPVLSGAAGLKELCLHPEAGLVVAAMSGTDGLRPLVAAIESGKQIALANKEALVSAGALIMEKVKQSGIDLVPVDSEHSAIFQCLQGIPQAALRRLILTASGGPFWQKSLLDLNRIEVRDALAHPTYRMGAKISVDSSTLMNKGLEVIEAHFLFGVKAEKIEVAIHPQSLVHSLVECVDGALLAQMSYPDMKLPIQFALTYPERRKASIRYFDFSREVKMEFFPPDLKRFPCLSLAYQALEMGGSAPCFLNGANQMLVERFLKKEIGWMEISAKLAKLISSHIPENMLDLEAILEMDRRAKQAAAKV